MCQIQDICDTLSYLNYRVHIGGGIVRMNHYKEFMVLHGLKRKNSKII